MKALIQRVSEASVTVDHQVIGQIGPGLLALIGVEKDDGDAQIEKMLHKLLHYRIFSDDNGKMNLGLEASGGGLLLVSQFTLVADTAKGLRPGFSRGASPEHGRAVFDRLLSAARERLPETQSGQFGADMQVALINDGPVTFMIEV
ncbi:D-aminoacyl-tRNA deacylase [Carnimonas nigrificans]|uniref:D-aminoacyl-tRNA deacylase n=1 Tax=Carnimonas nigrificans TaxID=64323 RepID=UPI00046F8F3B|nr:D-aminoacyl-tRNA deacylase [Carnimonas nigrificans]